MVTIKFRPLRFLKNGKIAVTSYGGWNNVRVADQYEENFNLIIIDTKYNQMNPSDYVYNHKGEILFWYNHQQPEELKKNIITLREAAEILDVNYNELEGEEWKLSLSEPLTKGFHWSVKGFDCEGTPIFSHYTEKYIATNIDKKNITDFEPLTVGIVVKWFGWFLLSLENANIKYV